MIKLTKSARDDGAVLMTMEIDEKLKCHDLAQEDRKLLAERLIATGLVLLRCHEAEFVTVIN